MSASEDFVRDLFESSGAHRNPARALQHFREAFVCPAMDVFEDLIGVLTPSKDSKKLVVIDGHPRTGKSWVTFAAVRKILDSRLIEEGTAWTSGVDSLKIFPSRSTALQDGIVALLDTLRAMPSSRREQIKILLLDDFLGGNRLRLLREPIDIGKLVEFFDWNENNPLVQLLPPGSVTVITGRSFCFLILETLLGSPMRKETSSLSLPTLNRRWGVFTGTKRQIVEGSFDSGRLERIAQRNRDYHPYADYPNWLILSAPLLAFDPRSELSEAQKPIAAQSLFADDLGALADNIRFFEQASFADLEQERQGEVVMNLERAYLAAIAPAIAFVGPDAHAFDAFGVQGTLAHQLRRSMYYSDERLATAVVPNEFYMRALRAHLGDLKHLAFAADCAGRHFLMGQLKTETVADKHERLDGLLLRGFVESAISQAVVKLASPESSSADELGPGQERTFSAGESISILQEAPTFGSLLEKYLKVKDPLLELELDVFVGRQSTFALQEADVSPGLVAATGWTLSKFFPESSYRTLHENVYAWLKESLTRRMAALPEGGITALRNDNLGEWHTLATSFSTYLQWAIATPDNEERARRVEALIDFVEASPKTALDLLRLILLDELVWALLEHALDCGDRATATLENALDQLKDNGQSDCEDAALLFSLSWHSAWKDDTRMKSLWEQAESKESRLAYAMWKQLSVSAQRVTDRIEITPRFIRENLSPILVSLQYHWLHFTTQRAVWMREWCFQPNPLAFEASRFSQVAAGSSDKRNNDRLLGFADEVFTCSDAFAIRNLLLMLSTRRHYLSADGFRNLLLRIEQKGIFLRDPVGSEEVTRGVLQSIFELHRQGFLDEPPVVEVDFADDDPAKTKEKLDAIAESESGFLKWCRGWLSDEPLVIHAWTEYCDEVKRVTYMTDLHPREDGYKELIRFLDGKLKNGVLPEETLTDS